MTIAEFFINLGVKGSEKTQGALSETKKKMGELKSMSLETKAAILAAFYGLERLFSKSGSLGTGMENFKALTGESILELQKFQIAFERFGVTGDNVKETIQNLQMTMEKTLAGGGAPAGLQRMAVILGRLTGQKFSNEDLVKWMRNPTELLVRMGQFARVNPEVAVTREILGSFGLSNEMIAALRRGALTPESLRKAGSSGLILNEKQVKSLDEANVKWMETWRHIFHQFDLFNAKYGPRLADDVQKIVDALIRLAESLEKTHFVDKIVGWIDKLSKASSEGITKTAAKGVGRTIMDTLIPPSFTAEGRAKLRAEYIRTHHIVVNNNPTVNQEINVGPGNDPKKVGDAAKKGAQRGLEHATRTNPAIARGT